MKIHPDGTVEGTPEELADFARVRKMVEDLPKLPIAPDWRHFWRPLPYRWAIRGTGTRLI